MKAKALVLVYLATAMAASAVTIVGVNFNNNDSAGAQAGGSSFGATWTDINSDNVTGALLTGTGITIDVAAGGWWAGGSWEGFSGPNSEISVMRSYLNDNGITITVHGLADWLVSQGMSGYTITLYTSSDNGTSFRDATVGGVPLPIPVMGNGLWDGTSEDLNGNNSGGIRGSATTGIFTADELTISLPSHEFPARASLAAFVITPVPEPATACLSALGALALLRRRKP